MSCMSSYNGNLIFCLTCRILLFYSYTVPAASVMRCENGCSPGRRFPMWYYPLYHFQPDFANQELCQHKNKHKKSTKPTKFSPTIGFNFVFLHKFRRKSEKKVAILCLPILQVICRPEFLRKSDIFFRIFPIGTDFFFRKLPPHTRRHTECQ